MILFFFVTQDLSLKKMTGLNPETQYHEALTKIIPEEIMNISRYISSNLKVKTVCNFSVTD